MNYHWNLSAGGTFVDVSIARPQPVIEGNRALRSSAIEPWWPQKAVRARNQREAMFSAHTRSLFKGPFRETDKSGRALWHGTIRTIT